MILYWDSSALVTTLIEEPKTAEVFSLLEELEEVNTYTSIITPLEIESAIQRKLKQHLISMKEAEKARFQAAAMRRGSQLVVTDYNVLDMALHLQKIYGLRVADSIQLASARVISSNPIHTLFVCLDKELNIAALQEGFDVPLECN